MTIRTSLQLFVILALYITCTAASQWSLKECKKALMNDGIPIPEENAVLQYGMNDWENGDPECVCTITPMESTYIVVSSKITEQEPDGSTEDAQQSDSLCPAYANVFTKGSVFYTCPMKNATSASFHLYLKGDDSLTVDFNNPDNKWVKFNLMIEAFGGVTVNCVEETDTPKPSTCPCNPFITDNLSIATKQTSLETRFVVAVVAVIIFLIIFAVILAIYCWYKKKDKEEKYLERVETRGTGTQNPGYANSQGNIQDPEMNLKLQKTAEERQYQGSTDSGLYSIPSEKPNPSASSAGTLGNDQTYNGQPRTPPQQNNNQSGFVALSPEDLEAVYAKPMKNRPIQQHYSPQTPAQLPVSMDTPRPQPDLVGFASVTTPGLLPGRTPSRDDLHLASPTDLSYSEMYMTDSSHNTSKASVNKKFNSGETDV